MPKWIQRNSIEDSTGSANEDKNIWNVTHSETIRHIWRVFLKIKIRWKNRLNISFDEEFNALRETPILTEKIDWGNCEKKKSIEEIAKKRKKKIECYTLRDNSSYMTSFFQDENPLQKGIHCIIR